MSIIKAYGEGKDQEDPAKRRGVKPIYSTGYIKKTAVMVDLLVSRPFLTNAELMAETVTRIGASAIAPVKREPVANQIRKAL
jgi:hypothetical protein